MKKTVCELFAGVGGFRKGLEQAGDWHCVWANQWEPKKVSQHAFNCYVQHFGDRPEHVNRDIAEIDKSTIPDHNLLVGGFPCQDYSVARTGAQGIVGHKGVLWWQIRDILIEKNPAFVLLENVDRLLKSPSSQRGRDFGIMLACFNDLGYSVEWRVINAADYGMAQRRRRTFIFACWNDTMYFNNINPTDLESHIHRNGFFADQFPIERESKLYSETELIYNDIADISNHFTFSFKNSGFMTGGRIYTEETIPIYENPVTIGEILEHNVDERYFLNGDLAKWKFLKGSKKIERTTAKGFKYTFSEGDMVFPDPHDRPARTMLTSESSLNRSTHVVSDLDHPERYRLITPVEAERINGFPDNWTNTGMPEKFRYFCMGNALVVGLIERMGRKLNQIFENEI